EAARSCCRGSSPSRRWWSTSTPSPPRRCSAWRAASWLRASPASPCLDRSGAEAESNACSRPDCMTARDEPASTETRSPGAQEPEGGLPRQPQPGTRRASGGTETEDGVYYLDLVADELSLARAQIASGLSALAEAVLVRRIAQLHAQGDVALDELDAARALLAEALWRQGRPIAAGAAAGRIRSGSLERRRPLVMLIEAEALAATGQLDTATRLMERIVEEVGIDDAWRLRS